ncbi:unnamed protein product, partial [Mesorhabditis spiculigera]
MEGNRCWWQFLELKLVRGQFRSVQRVDAHGACCVDEHQGLLAREYAEECHRKKNMLPDESAFYRRQLTMPPEERAYNLYKKVIPIAPSILSCSNDMGSGCSSAEVKVRTGECGKSTILKQMQILHSKGFAQNELAEKRQDVYSNIIVGMATIIRALDKFIYQLADQDREMDARRILAVAESEKSDHSFTPEVLMALHNLWKDPAIQKAFSRRSEFQIGDSFRHFMDDFDRIATPSYVPTVDDFLHIRVPTTGVVQVHITIQKCIFRVFDVGGQRSERRKWIHHFDDVNAVIYICAVNEYDQTLMEDNRTNRLQESMDLFETVCNSRWFKRASMILFLNKKDLFQDKIKLVPLTAYFRRYKGLNTYEEGMAFFEKEFIEMNAFKRHRRLYVHQTCATDTTQVQFVIDSVIDTVIGKNLRGAGIE